MCLGQTRTCAPAAIEELNSFKRKIADLIDELPSFPASLSNKVSTQPPPKKSRTTKHVRFADSSRNQEIPTLKTEPELTLTWYQNDDYAAFRRDSRALLRYLANGGRHNPNNTVVLDPTQCSFRGLETLVSASRRRASYLRKKASLLLILRQQKRQREKGMVDVHELRQICKVVSKGALKEALRMAAVDAQVTAKK